MFAHIVRPNLRTVITLIIVTEVTCETVDLDTNEITEPGCCPRVSVDCHTMCLCTWKFVGSCSENWGEPVHPCRGRSVGGYNSIIFHVYPSMFNINKATSVL